jgi:L-ascorbate metabolism protein UlaG (beta-lactamase superfamily)
MEIQFYGANCVSISYKQTKIIVDDNLKSLGQKSVTKNGDVALFTSNATEDDMSKSAARILINNPGEYEVGKISIYGIESRSHTDEEKQHSNTIYKIIAGGLNVVVVGHIYPDLDEKQLENIGMTDVLIIPVGGHGFTLDSQGANKIIKQIEPKLVIPTHFSDNSLKFPVPQDDLDSVISSIGMQPKETVQKIKLKAGELSDIRQLIVLEKS